MILFVSSKARWAKQHTAFSDQEKGGSANCSVNRRMIPTATESFFGDYIAVS